MGDSSCTEGDDWEDDGEGYEEHLTYFPAITRQKSMCNISTISRGCSPKGNDWRVSVPQQATSPRFSSALPTGRFCKLTH